MGPRPNYAYFDTTVTQVIDITPRMRRVTLQGDSLSAFASDQPGQWVKLFFSETNEGRAFTIRHWRRELCELDIDFVRHGHGLAGAWIADAKPGAKLRLAGPRSDFRYEEGRDLYLFGDETALPAISAIVEALPQNTRAFAAIEIADGSGRCEIQTRAKVEWAWLVNDRCAPSSIVGAFARALLVNPHDAQIWVGCECSVARELRCEFSKRGFDKSGLHASGYWKTGVVEHVDRESDY